MSESKSPRLVESLDSESGLGPTSSTWNHSIDSGYFSKRPISDSKDKSLLGLFFDDEIHSSGVLHPLPMEMIESEQVKSLTNLYDREFLMKTGVRTSKDIIFEEKQFVFIAGSGANLLKSFNVTLDLSIKEYTRSLISLLQFWNKYSIDSINPTIMRAINGLMSYIIVENDIFWASLNDDFTSMFHSRRFNVGDVKVTDENKDEALAFIGAIEGVEKRINKNEEDYEFDMKKAYQDISSLGTVNPVKIEDYYIDITHDDMIMIMQSCVHIGSAIALKMYAVIACSHKYYHLNLHPTTLDIVNRIEEPASISIYSRYMLYLMYKDETIHKTYSTPEHRHIISQPVAHRLRMIYTGRYANILPAINYGYVSCDSERNTRSGEHSLYPHISFGRGICTTAEFSLRLNAFTGGLLDILHSLRLPHPIYITGSIMTACALRVPRNLTSSEIKNASYSLDEDKVWYTEHYGKKSDVDIAVYASEGTIENTVKMVADETKGKVVKISDIKYRILTENVIVEMFQMFYPSPTALIYNFHMPSVRSYYDVAKREIYSFSSFVYAGLSGINIDYRFFASEKTISAILKKNASRGFATLVNRVEKMILGGDRHQDIDPTLGNAIFRLADIGLILGDAQRILQRSREYTISEDEKFISILTSLKASLFSHSISVRDFFPLRFRHIQVPTYPPVMMVTNGKRGLKSDINPNILLRLLRDSVTEKKVSSPLPQYPYYIPPDIAPPPSESRRSTPLYTDNFRYNVTKRDEIIVRQMGEGSIKLVKVVNYPHLYAIYGTQWIVLYYSLDGDSTVDMSKISLIDFLIVGKSVVLPIGYTLVVRLEEEDKRIIGTKYGIRISQTDVIGPAPIQSVPYINIDPMEEEEKMALVSISTDPRLSVIKGTQWVVYDNSSETIIVGKTVKSPDDRLQVVRLSDVDVEVLSKIFLLRIEQSMVEEKMPPGAVDYIHDPTLLSISTDTPLCAILDTQWILYIKNGKTMIVGKSVRYLDGTINVVKLEDADIKEVKNRYPFSVKNGIVLTVTPAGAIPYINVGAATSTILPPSDVAASASSR